MTTMTAAFQSRNADRYGDERDGEKTISGLFAQQSLHNKQQPSKKLIQLSVEERSEGLHDVHGVSDAVIETPGLISQKLEELDQELEKLHHKPAYTQAKQQNSDYVQALRLRFLRAENFYGTKAAARMERFFALKLKSFGAEYLARDIGLKDLPKEDLPYLKSGYLQLLPQRDRAGRAIAVMHGQLCNQTPIETTLRLVYFLCMNFLQDEEIQKKGFVLIYYGVGQTEYHRDRPMKIVGSWLSLPWRVVAAHTCYDNPRLHPLMRLTSIAMSGSALCRFRTHFGAHLECQYNLMTFGIPKELFAVTCDGEIELQYHLRWLKGLETHERASESSNSKDLAASIQNRILVPGPMDIIMGRGRHGHSSPGNLRLKLLLEEHRIQYEAADKFEKTVLTQLILKKMKESECRFVKSTEESGWVMVADEVASKKISHAFRNLRVNVGSSNAARKRGKRPLVLPAHHYYDRQGAFAPSEIGCLCK